MSFEKMLLMVRVLGLILVSSLVSSEDQPCADHYGNVVPLVYLRLRSSGVYFVSPDAKSYEWYSSTSKLVRALSSNQISWLTIELEEVIPYATINLDPSILSPLVVFPVNSFEDIEKLNDLQIHLNRNKIYGDISRPFWLLLLSPSNASINQQCYEPSDFSIKLSFKSEIFVWCCQKPNNLYQWYSIDGKNVFVENFGYFNSSMTGLELTDDRPYFLRRNLQKNEFYVSLTSASRLYQKFYDTGTDGYLVDIIDELSRVMNFTLEIFRSRPTFGKYDSISEQWTDVMGDMINGSNLGGAGFSMLIERMAIVKYTHQIFSAKYKMYYKRPDEYVIEWDGYFKSLSFNIWIAVIVLIIITTVLLTIMQYKRNNNFTNIISERWLNTWGIFCQQGLATFPSDLSAQITYVSIFVTSIVVLAAYSAALISFIASATLYIPFRTIDEFVSNTKYLLFTVKETAEYEYLYETLNIENDEFLMKVKKRLRSKTLAPWSFFTAIDQVCSGWNVLFMSEKIIDSFNKYPCSMIKIDTGRFDNLGMVVEMSSPYLKLINYYLTRMRIFGVLNRQEKVFFPPMIEPEEEFFKAVTFVKMIPIFIILLGGYAFSGIILFIEKLYYLPKNESLLNNNISQKEKHHFTKKVQFKRKSKRRKFKVIKFKH